ncbi:hypothetical protein ACGFZC_01435 [[Kitasatospora] papulosa]|uniref:hypothetical protein n=1 Tax=[Kitasatospora] papulosa TaxID=1464011 RepID=UPI0037164885
MTISNATMHLDIPPEQLALHDASGPFPVLQFGSELTMHLDQTPTDTMQAVIDLLTKVVETRDAAAKVPAEVAGEDGVRWIGVPQQRQGAAA